MIPEWLVDVFVNLSKVTVPPSSFPRAPCRLPGGPAFPEVAPTSLGSPSPVIPPAKPLPPGFCLLPRPFSHIQRLLQNQCLLCSFPRLLGESPLFGESCKVSLSLLLLRSPPPGPVLCPPSLGLSCRSATACPFPPLLPDPGASS